MYRLSSSSRLEQRTTWLVLFCSSGARSRASHRDMDVSTESFWAKGHGQQAAAAHDFTRTGLVSTPATTLGPINRSRSFCKDRG